MLVEFAALLVVIGLGLLVVGIIIARQYTLRSKLLTAFLVIVLMSIGALSVIDNHLMRESLTLSANKTLGAAAKQYASRVDQFNNSTLGATTTASKLPALVSYLNDSLDKKYTITEGGATALENLRILQSRDANAISYALLSPAGLNVLDTVEANIGNDESNENYFQRIIKGDDAYRSPISFIENAPSLFYSSRVKNSSGKFIGVLRAQFNADVLSDIVKSARGYAGFGSFAVLLDENMLRLVHGRRPDLKYTLAQTFDYEKLSSLREKKRVPNLARLDNVENILWVSSVDRSRVGSEAFVKHFHGLGSDLYTAAVSRLNSAPWKIIFAQPQYIVLQPVAKQTSIALLLAGVVAIVVMIIVLGTTQVLLGPVRRLTNVINAVAGGALNKKAVIEANDEIGGLARAFNSMTSNIEALVSDLEEEVKSHQLTSDNLRKLSLAIEQSPNSVMITDLDGNIEYVNPELCRSSGYTENEIIGQNARILSSDQTSDYQHKKMWDAIKSGKSWHGELFNKKKNGELFWENVTISPIKSKEGESTHYLAIKEDITLRKEYEEKLLYQATYDKLTDLPNRSLAFDRLQQAIAIAVRENRRLAVLYIDFDHFKNINDTLGHTAGDNFLILMAGRLKKSVRDVDTVARLGGDEYLIILTDVGEDIADDSSDYQQSICTKTKDILIELALPCFLEDREFSITASIGVAIFPEDGDDPHVLLRNADTAMYRSKRKGRNTMELYAQEMNDTVVRRVEIESKLLHALENERFYLVYQPLVDAQTRELVGAEALLRWNDESLGDVPPEVFIPIAEQSGLIVEISNWVINQSCKDLKHWHEISGNEDIYTAINLSSRQFRDVGLVQVVRDALSRHELPGRCVELEITERMLMKDVADVVAMLNQLKEMQISLSIDDFGTGYSSLSYLKRFPFDALKIDRAFVKDIGVDPDDEALCDAIISIAHSLGLKVIGEGVETEEQYEFLRERGTEVIQGYLISKPLTNDDFIEQIKSPKWRI